MLLISGLLALTVGAGAAAPAAIPLSLERAFSGTIVSTYPDGRKAELWLNRNGTYVSEGRRHDRHSGRWNLKGNQVCFKRGIFGYCTAIPSSSEFTTRAVTGETIRVRLIPGRGRGPAG
ncbi:MAG: hypothetical protein JSR45_05430 [Proteobacteria bacterium]|nr:hypothetical protein [Pseudomonadota bacterium]